MPYDRNRCQNDIGLHTPGRGAVGSRSRSARDSLGTHLRQVSDRVSYTAFLTIGALCIVAFFVLRVPRAPNQCVLNTDGIGYFSYLRSVVFDGDINFSNEYAHFDPDYPFLALRSASTGLPGNLYSVGPALLWAPFYLAAHVASGVARMVGIPVDTDGYGILYQSGVCMATIAYVMAGCVLSYHVCRRYFSGFASLVAVGGVWLASSLFHYTVAACDMSHGVSFFAVSLFLFLLLPPRRRTYREWILLGLAAGIMSLVRWQDVLYTSMVAVEAVQAVAAESNRGKRFSILRAYAGGGLVAALVAAALMTPQAFVWLSLYGSPAPPIPGEFFDMLHPNLLAYLFSTRHGLFVWHPIMLLAAVGFVPLWRRDRRVTAALVVALVAQWYLNSATAEWWAQASFGARRFVSATPLLALGMAALVQSFTNRFRRGALVAVAAVSVLICWNFLFDVQYSWGFIPRDQAVSIYQLTVGKLEMILQLINQIVS